MLNILRNTGIAGALLLAGMAPTCSKAQAPTPTNAKAQATLFLTSKLFVAITNHDDAAVKSAIAKGADPNGRNWVGFAPTMWAAARGSQSEVDFLLTHGAKLNDLSPYGSSLSFALMGRHEKLALYLISKGADIHAKRLDGACPLILAAQSGCPEVVSTLIKRGENLNVQDVAGDTALICAARTGQVEIIKILLKAGAPVNTADHKGKTALMEAASTSQTAAVAALVEGKPAINVQDPEGNTALILAAKYCSDAALTDTLLKHGANPKLRDHHGNSALSLAVGRNHNNTAARLRQAGIAVPKPTEAGTPLDVSTSVTASIGAVQGSMTRFAALARCGSCHHQGLGLMTLGMAGDSGFQVDGKLIGSYLKNMGEDGKVMGSAIHAALVKPDLACTVQSVDIDEFAVGSGYLFNGMLANHVPANPGFEEVAAFTAQQQKADGHWNYGLNREPMQVSPYIITALTVKLLANYGTKAPGGNTQAAIDKAKAWLISSAPSDAESCASKVLGLKWAGATEAEIATATKAVVNGQNVDGGWSQSKLRPSDAYATGLSLYALRVGASMPVEAAPVAQSIHYLLINQDHDGTWYVRKSAMPANNYFDTGFPYGESQYASFAATCWSAMALMSTLPPKVAVTN